jgi:hypothetical protein
MDNDYFESTRLWKKSKQKLTIFPYSSFIHGEVLIIAHLDQISYPFPSK